MALFPVCEVCEKRITSDNAALCVKFFGVDPPPMLRYDCIAARCECSVEQVKEVELNYRRLGCTLFSPLEEE